MKDEARLTCLCLLTGNAQLGGLDPSLYLDPDRIEEKEEVCMYMTAIDHVSLCRGGALAQSQQRQDDCNLQLGDCSLE